MSFLVIAGIVVPTEDGSFSENTPAIGGSNTPSFNGTLRSRVRWSKRRWQCQTALMLDADSNALKAAVASRSGVACSGDGLGGAVTCVVIVGDVKVTTAATSDGLNFMRVHALTLMEV